MPFVLLASLTYLEAGHPASQRELADHAATDPMMTSQVLRVLEGRGLLTRETHPADRRARSLRVTAEGRALANRAVVDVEACDESCFRAPGSRRPDFVTDLTTSAREAR